MSMPMASADSSQPGIVATAIAALAGLFVRVSLRLARLDHVMSAVRWLASKTRRDATRDDLLRVLQTVDAGAAWLPVRIACLERSLTAVLLLATHRTGVTWRMGARTPPLATHAWLVDPTGEPVGEPSPVTAYQPLITISTPPRPNRSTT